MASLCGVVAWSGHFVAIPLSLALFPVLSAARSRTVAFLSAFGYYTGSTWPVLSGAGAFFGHAANPVGSCALWLGAALVLAVPISLLWSASSNQRAWRIPLAIAVTAIPPIGTFDVASPLTAAGVMFPGMGWLGLTAIVVLIGGLSSWQGQAWRNVATAFACLALSSNLSAANIPIPEGWQTVDTNFGGAGLNTPSSLDLYEHETQIRKIIASGSAKVLIFPESVVYRWTRSTDVLWKDELDRLGSSGRTVLIGGGISLPEHRYLNAVLIRGKDAQGPFLQRIPVPGGMWRPFDHTSVPMRPFGPSVLNISGQRVAPIICYEQLLPWPILASAWHRPTLVVGISNEYWARETYIPKIQQSTLNAWSRLFSLPVLAAVNR
jgi:hypothetical protein